MQSLQKQVLAALLNLAELVQTYDLPSPLLEEFGLDWPFLLRLREADEQLRDLCGPAAQLELDQ